jgi:hypothetical protein
MFLLSRRTCDRVRVVAATAGQSPRQKETEEPKRFVHHVLLSVRVPPADFAKMDKEESEVFRAA